MCFSLENLNTVLLISATMIILKNWILNKFNYNCNKNNYKRLIIVYVTPVYFIVIF